MLIAKLNISLSFTTVNGSINLTTKNKVNSLNALEFVFYRSELFVARNHSSLYLNQNTERKQRYVSTSVMRRSLLN